MALARWNLTYAYCFCYCYTLTKEMNKRQQVTVVPSQSLRSQDPTSVHPGERHGLACAPKMQQIQSHKTATPQLDLKCINRLAGQACISPRVACELQPDDSNLWPSQVASSCTCTRLTVHLRHRPFADDRGSCLNIALHLVHDLQPMSMIRRENHTITFLNLKS